MKAIHRFGRWALGVAACGTLGVCGATAVGQETPKTKGEARVEGREKVQESRETVRDAAKGGRETVREAREGVREARREARHNWRAADFGMWLNRRAGTSGLIVADVTPQGASSKLGFQEGDHIIAVDGTPVATEAEFTRLLTDESVRNKQVNVTVQRGGKEQKIAVQPSTLMQDVATYDPLWQYGLVLDEQNKDRIVVQRVFPRTPAYYAGLKAGDTVVGLRGQRIAAVADLARALAQNADRLALQISRGNQTRDLELEHHSSFGGDVHTAAKPALDANGNPLPADQQPRIESNPAVRPAPTPTPAPRANP